MLDGDLIVGREPGVFELRVDWRAEMEAALAAAVECERRGLLRTAREWLAYAIVCERRSA